MLLSGPATIGVTTRVTVAVLKGGSMPRKHSIVLVPLQVPWLAVTETRFTFAGKVSVSMIFSTGPGGPPPPWLCTVMV